MKTFGVNSNNDIFIDKTNNLSVLTDLDAIGIVCKQAVQAQLGEMVLETTTGIPYQQVVFNGNPDANKFRAAIIDTLTNISNVQQVSDVEVTQSGNELDYSATIQTDYGTTQL